MLLHAAECTSWDVMKRSKDLVAGEVLERESEEDTRQWTVTGLRKCGMFRLLQGRATVLY